MIDLGEVARFEADLPLPRQGTLSFFYALDRRPWGFDPSERGGWRVVHVPHDAGQRVPPPANVAVVPRVPLSPSPVVTAPDWEEGVLVAVSERDGDRLLAFRDEWSERVAATVQVGGWPALLQGPIQGECQLAANGIHAGSPSSYQSPRALELLADTSDWRLLAQFDLAELDPDGRGALFYAIRTDDLLAGSFDKVWLVHQRE